MDRRKVLEYFEKNSDFYASTVNNNIEKYRKGDLKITVADKNGNYVSGANVKIKQLNHEFKFGANLFLLDEMETPEKNEAYKKYFADTFNTSISFPS